jgi:transglutaminase-like putative cysteine protease
MNLTIKNVEKIKIESRNVETVPKVIYYQVFPLSYFFYYFVILCVSLIYFYHKGTIWFSQRSQRAFEAVCTLFRPVSTYLIHFSALLIILLIVSCSDHHLIKDGQYLSATEKAFAYKKGLAVKRDSALFSVFNQKLSLEQSEALKFLYAYMPLNDLADYNGDFFLENVNVSLKAKKETIWGNTIPEAVFLHYVLPYRVNNENLDSFRRFYYDELINRVKGKDLREAALEINHWCHEKVNYQASDIRTSAPMSTILSGRGRCGEESTFTVAALRTVGIPARQVYTPRWAHSDDNHAWVEIWYDGNWYYMGACEPEPVLDRGWFTEPARRAMLVHTKSFGAFTGNENVINKSSNYTNLNNLAKYAVTKKIFVKVLDKDNQPVNNALVEYQLYNYAEFYPLAVIPTDEKGISGFETGLGDLMIWAHKGDDFDFRKISVSEADTLKLTLKNGMKAGTVIDLDLDVPVVHTPFTGPPQELIDRNASRINAENIIHKQYTDSWMKAVDAVKLAISKNIDTARVKSIIERSMGNHKEICSFLSATPDSLMRIALSLLELLPDKDLRDVKSLTLSEHIRNTSFNSTPGNASDDRMFLEYVLNPRIANEMLVPWRHYFSTNLPSQLVKNAPDDPSLIVSYLNDSIKISEEENYYHTPITPIGVDELKVSDRNSRAICFVAICRSLGIPSRLEPGRNLPQFYFNKNWNDVYFSDQKKPDLNKGFLKLRSSDTKPVPEYYIHFTIARFENGRYTTLEYDYNKKITDFTEEISLPPGHYMLVTGNRLADSKILSEILFFDLSENEHKTLDVKIRKDLSEKKILGSADLNKINKLIQAYNTSESCVNEKGAVIIWAEPDKEPTRHIFNDLPLLKKELDAWGGKFLVLSVGSDKNSILKPESVKGLPVNTSYAADDQLTILSSCVSFIQQPEISLPLVIVTDVKGNIHFVSSGYRIGIGEQILKYIH